MAERAHPARWLAVGGIAGPAVFVADWAALGAAKAGYSPVADAISRLAATGATTRGAMTAGFVVYGAGLVTHAWALRSALPGRAWTWVAATGVTTFGVAAFPLGTPVSGNVHAAFAAAGYATLAAAPLTAARALGRGGHRAAAVASVAAGAVTALALLASVVGPDGVHGLWQRVGLTTGDVWVMAGAAVLLRRRR